MNQRLCNLAIAGLSCICLLGISFWIRSHWRNDEVEYWGQSLIHVESCRDKVVFWRETCAGGWTYSGTFEFHSYESPSIFLFPAGVKTTLMGAGFFDSKDGWIDHHILAMPYSMIVGIAGVIIVTIFFSRSKRRRSFLHVDGRAFELTQIKFRSDQLQS